MLSVRFRSQLSCLQLRRGSDRRYEFFFAEHFLTCGWCNLKHAGPAVAYGNGGEKQPLQSVAETSASKTLADGKRNNCSSHVLGRCCFIQIASSEQDAGTHRFEVIAFARKAICAGRSVVPATRAACLAPRPCTVIRRVASESILSTLQPALRHSLNQQPVVLH